MPGHFLHNQFPNQYQTIYLKADTLPSEQCPSKLYSLPRPSLHTLSPSFPDLVQAFKGGWPSVLSLTLCTDRLSLEPFPLN